MANIVSTIPLQVPMNGPDGRINLEWANWFRDLYAVVSSADGNVIIAIWEAIAELEARVTQNELDIIQNIMDIATNADGISRLDTGLLYTPLLPIGDTYLKYSFTIEGDWSGVANKDTTDSPAPVLLGDPFNAYNGTIGSDAVLVKQVIAGQRYTFAEGGFINEYRVNTVIGNEYQVYSVKDPLGSPIINLISSFTATVSGWVNFNIIDVFVNAGEPFDLIVKINEPDPAPVIFTGDWNYFTPNNDDAPAVGQILQSNSSPNLFNVNYTDNISGDRKAELVALSVGDIIEKGGLRWSIQSNTDNGTYATFGVAPAVQDSPDGLYTFAFETTAPVPVTYAVDVDYWLGSATVQGLFIADGDYNDIVPNDNAYGVDLVLQRATVSPDWDLLPSGGSASNNSGSNNVTSFVSDTGYGSEDFFSTTANNQQLALSVTTGNLSGDYIITVNYIWNYTRRNRKFKAELFVNTSAGTSLMLHEEEPQDTGNLVPTGFSSKPINLSGVNTLDFYVWTSNNSDTATATDISITYRRV